MKMKEEEIKEIANKWFNEGIKRASESKKWPEGDDFFEKVWLEEKVGIQRLVNSPSHKKIINLPTPKEQLVKVKEFNTKVKDFIQKGLKKE